MSHLLAWRGKDLWSILHPGVEWWIHLLYPWSHLFIYKLCEQCNVLPWLMKELKWHHSGHWITTRGKYIALQTGHRVSNTWVNRLTSMERHLFRELICRCMGCLTVTENSRKHLEGGKQSVLVPWMTSLRVIFRREWPIIEMYLVFPSPYGSAVLNCWSIPLTQQSIKMWWNDTQTSGIMF